MHGDACRQHSADMHAASAGCRPQKMRRTPEHAAVAAAGGTETTRALSAGEPPVTSKRSMPRNRSRLFNQSTGEGDSLQNAVNAFQVGQGATGVPVTALVADHRAPWRPRLSHAAPPAAAPRCAVCAPWPSLISVGMAGLHAGEPKLSAACPKRPQHSQSSRASWSRKAAWCW